MCGSRQLSRAPNRLQGDYTSSIFCCCQHVQVVVWGIIHLWEVRSDDTGRNDRMRTKSSSLNLDSLSNLATRRIFAGCSISSSTSRDRFITE